MGRYLYLGAVFLCLIPSLLLGQTFSFQTYGLEDGLPQSQVTSLAQDREGYIWVGTDGGLVRFNGERFIPFITQPGLPSSRIAQLLVDSRGVLWIATQRGLARWQEHRMTAITDAAVAKTYCRTLAEDGRGNLWVGTHHGLAMGKNGVFVSIRDDRGQDMGMVYDLLPDGDGILGISTRGLFRAWEGSPAVRVARPPAPEDSLRALARTSDGLWVSTSQHGLFFHDGRRWNPGPAGLLKARTVYWMSESLSGTFYVASRDEGLFRRRKGLSSFEVFNKANGLVSNVVNCALEDDQGNLWIGTDINGLARLRNPAIINYRRSDGLPEDCVFGITPAGRPDEAWFGTTNGAIRCRLNGRLEILERISTRDGLADNRIWKVVTTPQGEDWVMTDVAYHRRGRGQTRFTPLPKGLSIPAQEIYALALDAQGRVWFAGMDYSASLAACDAAGRWRSWNRSAEGNSVLRCRGVSPRSAGGVWVTADSRILYSDGLVLHEMPERPPVLTGAVIDVVFEDRAGRLWAGFDGGLAVREDNKGWRLIKSAAGYALNQVYFISEDREGTIWVGVTNGALRILASGRMEMLSSDEGLAGIETNQDAFYQAPDGSVWIGTVGGVSRIDLKHLPTAVTAPPVIVEAAELPGRALGFPQALDLAWRDRNVTFRVAVLSYGGHREGTYRARLQGMETEWVLSRRNAGLRYTNIPPGRYWLQLQASLEAGDWGPMQNLPVRVRTPYWLTWWFRLAILFLAAGLAVGVFLRRTHLLRKRANQLERTVAERTEELVAANKELGRLATHDPLTGLWNRRAILDSLAAACRPKEGVPRQPFGLIMIDIDDFKKVNDELGHIAGDYVLRSVAQQIEGQTRQKDMVGRYGGDEFLVILEGADPAAVESAARRIAEKSYTTPVGSKSVTVTVSCGALTLGEQSPLTETSVLARTDDLLYKTKRSGKHGFLIDALRPVSGRHR